MVNITMRKSVQSTTHLYLYMIIDIPAHDEKAFKIGRTVQMGFRQTPLPPPPVPAHPALAALVELSRVAVHA